MDELPIGRRVAWWRGRRRMSQQQFADRIGKSKSWVDKTERGVRRLDKLSVLQEMADALRVDVGVLIRAEAPGTPAGTQAGTSGVEADVEPIRVALSRYDAALATCRQPARSPVQIRGCVSHAWLTYLHADYRPLLRTLPALLAEAQLNRAADRGGEAYALLGEIYQITAGVLRKVGQSDLAWLAADRGMATSAESGDVLLAARAAVTLGGVLRERGRPREAVELCLTVAYRIAPPNPLDAGPEHLSVYGSLLLQAAMGAAGQDDGPGVRDLLDQAAEAAEIVGEGENHYWTHFGPTRVALVRLAAGVALGEGAVVVAEHQEISGRPAYSTLPPGHRADHLVDVARGRLQAGDPAGAGLVVLAAERTAAAEVRTRPVAHRVLTEVLRLSRPPDLAVARLAGELGLTV